MISDYKPRIYPYPTIVHSCCNCPAFKVRWSTSCNPIALVREVVCNEFNGKFTREMVEKAMDGEFPEFCKLEVVK
jgi:hypothetical protein